ncbi:MAG: DUF362 domain-containing protein [Candidatus Thorarchaeota archaeon]
MTGDIIDLGPAKFTDEGSREAFMEIVSGLRLEPPVIIKPNWSSSMVYTESEILDWVLSAIDGEILIVESYAAWRTSLFIGHRGPRDDEFVRRLDNQKRDDFRENDKWFLRHSGIDRVLEKHGVEYLNLSEELWANRMCDSDMISAHVGVGASTVENSGLYALVPERLYELRGGTLLSLAKPKRSLKAQYVSLTLKNLFGMIPSPWRGKYHGDDDSLLSPNIVDINRVYNALFNVKGVIEAVYSTSETLDNILHPTIHRDMGLIWSGVDILEIDALVCSQLGLNPRQVDYLQLASEKIKQWDEDTVEVGMANPVRFPEA